MESIFAYPFSVWKKLFKMYYNVDVSEDFLACADVQLSSLFHDQTGLEPGETPRLGWSPEDIFIYKKDIISIMSSHILLKYGKKRISILWKSKSGRTYNMTDENIDCNDIEFWFEGIEANSFRHLQHPKWSIVTFYDDYQKQFKRNYGLDISLDFIRCLDEQLTPHLEKVSGLKASKDLRLLPMLTVDTSNFPPGEVVYLPDGTLTDINFIQGQISKFKEHLWVNQSWVWVTIKWKSKSGRIYNLEDVGIDCNDIQFWLEDVDVRLIYELLYPNQKLPFKLKDLSYQLIVTRINLDSTIEMILKEDVTDAKGVAEKVDSFITEFNEKSERKGRLYGVVHNRNADISGRKIVFEIDLGSTGAGFLKKFLLHLSKLGYFSKVEIC